MDPYDLAGVQALLDGLDADAKRRRSAASDLKFAFGEFWKLRKDADFAPVLPRLAKLLRDADADRRTLAAFALRGFAMHGFAVAAVATSLHEALDDTTRVVRQDAARALVADALRRGAWGEVEALLARSDQRVRLGVLAGLQ